MTGLKTIEPDKRVFSVNISAAERHPTLPKTRRFQSLLALLGVLLAFAAPAFALNATWNAATDVPVTAASYTASGTADFSLNFAPATGTNLTVVKNTGLPFISGTFSNLAQGQSVLLGYGGVNYSFVANYYGGTGNDLVLQWANIRPMAWGNNSSGQLGNNSVFGSSVPVAVDQSGVLAGKTVIAMSPTSDHSLALCSDGTLAAWGNNYDGRLGNGSTTQSYVPVAVFQNGVLAGKTVIAATAGGAHNVVLCSDGTLAAWGANYNGELGNGSTTGSTVPVAVTQTGVLAGKTVIALATGVQHSLALCSDGTLATWGSNYSGELGNNSTTGSTVPVAVIQTGVLAGKTVIAIAAGTNHNLALCSDGTVAAWGYNSNGQLGNSSPYNSSVPVAVDQSGVLSGKTVTAVIAGNLHSLALCSDGTLAAWGYNSNSQLGNNSVTQSTVPVAVIQSGVLAGKTVTAIAAGGFHSFALCSDGTLSAWGANGEGQLGNNSTTNGYAPTLVSTSTLAAGGRFVTARGGPQAIHSLALVASPPPPPAATTLAATSITTTGATLNGTVNANNNSAAVSFDYGSTAGYGTNVTGTPTPITGSSATAVSATITGLASGTTYHFRVNGVSAAGTGNGSDLTFTTLSTNANLSNLSLSSGTLSPAFSSATTGYTANVPYATTSITVTPAVADSTATVKVNGTAVVSGSASAPISLNLGSNLVTTVVTAQDGVTTMTYTVAVTRAPASSNANLANLVLSSGTLSPVFSSATTGYAATVPNSTTTVTVTPTVADSTATVKVNGTTVVSGSASGLVNLIVGANAITTVVTAQNGTLQTYTVILTLTAAPPLSWSYNSAGDLPVTATGYGASGMATLTLNFAPPLGTSLTVVKNTGPAFISGSFSNLVQGQMVTLSYGGNGYSFIVNYYGGTGNDLVLQWPNSRPLAWGLNDKGQLGISNTTNSSAPVSVLQSGVLSGKTVVAVAPGGNHTLALCSDGTLAAWGYNTSGQLGTGSTTQSMVPVAVIQNGVLAGKTVIAIAAGEYHSLALCSDGTVAAWGLNAQGQLGINSTTSSTAPVAVLRTSGALSGKTVVAVAAGDFYSLALCSDGTMAAWGLNDNGQLGNNSTSQSNAPVTVVHTGVLSGKAAVAIAAGQQHGLALCADGTLAAWGLNSLAQLGNGNTVRSLVPVAVLQNSGVLAGKTVVSIAAGATHNLALCSDGTVAGWGANGNGQFGNNSTWSGLVLSAAFPPDGVLSGKTIVAIAAGRWHNLVLCSDGTLAAAGYNIYGQLGNGSTTDSSVPVLAGTAALAAGETIVGISGSGSPASHSLALVASPLHSDSNLANLTLNSSTLSPAFAAGTASYTATTANASTSVTPTAADSTAAVQVNGVYVPYGSSASISLAMGANVITTVVTAQDGTTSTYTVTLTRGPLSWTYNAATDVADVGFNYTAAGTATLTLNFAPPVGTSLMVVKNTGPAFISGTFSNLVQGQTVTLSYGGKNYGFIVNYYGGTGNDLVLQWPNIRPMAWGGGNSGQLGYNSMANSNVPVAVLQTGVLAGKTVVASAEGGFHSLALCSDGTLAAWGESFYGQLGNGSTTQSSVPVAVLQTGVLAGKTVVAVAAGPQHNLALCSDGTVAAWGYNSWGQLGNGGFAQSTVPVAVIQSGVLSGKTVVAVAVGANHSLALCSDGTLAAWGYNSNGQLGNSTYPYSQVPVAVVQSGVLAGKTVVAVAAGANHNLVLCSDGTLAAWGINNNGQLGNNSTVQSSAPVLVRQTTGVLSGKTVVAVAAGAYHNLALCADGTVAAWGYNSAGQLGINSTTQSTVPVAVLQTGVLAARTVTMVSAGLSHSLALCSDGTLAAWGANSNGQLGNNTFTGSTVPVLTSTSPLAAGERFIAASSGQSASHTLGLVASPLRSNANLAGLTLGSGVLVPAFAPGTPNYTASTSTAISTVIPTVADNAATVQVNGMPVASGSASPPIALAPGANLITIVVTAQDGTTGTYAVTLASAPLSWTYHAATDVPDSGVAYTASGTAALSLNFAPPAGTSLTVVKNTGPGFISGTFSNLAQGQAVTLGYGGVNYHFIANYYGGKGRDLVLQWADVRPMAWGYDVYGQLGDSRPPGYSLVPVSVFQSGVLAGKTVTAVRAGQHHSIALCSDGTVAAWGSNSSGQLGNNSTTSSTAPVAVLQGGVLAGKTVTAVAAGDYHTLALCSDGTIVAWGSNSYGQLGNNSTTNSPVPVAVDLGGVLAGKTITGITAGSDYSLALCSEGTAAAWGYNGSGQLGNNSTTSSPVPVMVVQAGALAGKTITALAAGDSTTLALCSDGTVAAWGNNNNGQLGNNSTTGSSVPVAVVQSGALAGKTVTALSAGTYHCFALCSDGTLAAWGYNIYGQLGNNSTTSSSVPVPVDQSGALAGKTVTAVDCGIYYSLALCSDGTLAAWGNNFWGAFGDNSRTNSPVPVPVAQSGVLAGKTPVALAAGFQHSLTLCSDGSLAAWGYGVFGQLGDNGPLGYAPAPVPVVQGGVLAAKTVTAMTTGTYHTLALCSDGTLAAWGRNTNGQLGNNSTTDSNVPVAVDQTGVLAGKTVIALAAGSAHSLALCSDGTVAAWGYNFTGQLGNGNNSQSTAPVAVVQGGVLAGRLVTAIAAGGSHSLALCSDGRVAAWGYNSWGQLGNNSTTSSNVPVPVTQTGVLAGKTVTAIAAGQYHSLTLSSDGTLAAWGQNFSYQLGITGSPSQSPVPVSVLQTGVLAGKTVTSISTGDSHNLVLCSDGTLATWGYNGTSFNHTPALVYQTSGALAGRTVVAISAGAQHSLAQCSDGTLAAWGDNSYGQLGIDSTADSSVPAIVSTSTLNIGEGFAAAGSGAHAYHTLALVATPPPPPAAVTFAASAITSTGATLNGTVNASGNSTAVSFDYGISTSYGTNVAGTPTPLTGDSATPVSATLTGLIPGTTYHFRAKGASGAGTANGNDLAFTTPATPQEWRMKWYGTTDNTGYAANDADPYGRGIQNLTVFALLGPGQNPATASIAQLPQVQMGGGNLFISFTEPPGVTGVTYGAESSPTLQGDWQPVPDTGTGTLHIFSVPIGSNTLLFLRLKVTVQ
jgi:alpha-tubulin suppressor-like RCC1 family protein